MKINILLILGILGILGISCNKKEQRYSTKNTFIQCDSVMQLNQQLYKLLLGLADKYPNENRFFELYINKRDSDYELTFNQCSRFSDMNKYIRDRQPLNYFMIEGDTTFIYTGLEHFLNYNKDSTSFFYKKIYTRGGDYSWGIILNKKNIYLLNDYFVTFTDLFLDPNCMPYNNDIQINDQFAYIKTFNNLTFSSDMQGIIKLFIRENIKERKDNSICVYINKKGKRNYLLSIGYLNKKCFSECINLIYLEGIPVYVYTGLEDFIFDKKSEEKKDLFYRSVDIVQPSVSWNIILDENGYSILRENYISWDNNFHSHDTVNIDSKLYTPNFPSEYEESE